MDKVFSTKIQEINSPSTALGDHFSSSFVFDSGDNLMEEHRGKMFAVLDVKGEKAATSDLSSVAKLVFTVLKETYYGDLEGTPLQALEKSLHMAREKISNMPDTSLDFDLIVAALWGKVLYVAQFGSCLASIIRGDKELNIAKETKGEIIVSSGIVEKGDVLILGSYHFKQLFPEGSLAEGLSKLNDSDFLINNPKISSVIVRFDVSDLWGKDEVIKFVAPAKNAAFSSLFGLKSKVFKSILKEETVKVPKEDLGTRSRKKEVFLWVLALFLICALGVSIFITIKKSSSRQEAKSSPSSIISQLSEKVEQAKSLLGSDDERAKQLLSEVSGVSNFDNLPEEDKEKLKNVLGEAVSILDEINKVERVSSADVIYDSIADGVESIKGMAAGEGVIVIWSSVNDDVIKITFSDDTVSSSKNSFGVSLLSGDIYDEKFFGISESGFYLSSVELLLGERSEVSGEAGYENTKVLRLYYGNGYMLGEGSIVKLSSLVSGFAASSWLKDEVSLEGAIDLAIDGNIYILFSNGDIKKFYVGEEQDDFSVRGLSEVISEPKYIYTNIDLNEVFVLDSKDKSIVVLDKTGEYQKKYVIDDDSLDFESVKGFAISDSGKEAYILVGTKLVKVDL